MGLDISHIKAILERPNTINPFELRGVFPEDASEFNVPFEHFRKYVQLIDWGNIIDHSIVVIKNPNNQQEILEHFRKWVKGNHIFFVLEDKEKLEQEIASYEKSKKLDAYHKYANEGFFGKSYTLVYYEIIKKEGFYTKSVGYQRKGMNDKFWERFHSDEVFNFALKEDFDFAYSCIDNYWSDDTEEDVELTKKMFKENFLDTFESGASFLSLSY